MSKTTFRATISDEDFDWLQDFKDNNDLMINTIRVLVESPRQQS